MLAYTVYFPMSPQASPVYGNCYIFVYTYHTSIQRVLCREKTEQGMQITGKKVITRVLGLP